jgi:hypothetical protein
MYEVVAPAKAGVQEMNHRRYWRCIPCGQIPAFAGMTGISDLIVPY